MAITWDDFDKFNDVIEEYMPIRGEGETMASQIATAVNKLIYKYFNDGDVFDNTGNITGWMNDLSSYANWLYDNTDGDEILTGIRTCYTDDEYIQLLMNLAEKLLDSKVLAEYAKCEKEGSIYECDGPFRFVDKEDYEWDEDSDNDWDDEEEW